MSTTVIEALRSGLAGEMEADSRVVAMGEDISIGGSFHLSLGLLDRFGPERILDTPVAEAGFVGLAIGAAIGGLRPVVDFQYGDFLLPAADQIIQQASKFRLMSGGKVRVPLTLHAPTGASGRGAQHANSIENLFFGVPGLAVGVPSNPYDAKGMFTTAIRHPDPVLICSHKHLYGSKGRAVEATALGDVPDEPYELPIGQAEVRRPGADVTIVGALLMVHRALAAADELAAEGIEAEVVDLRWLSPMDTDTVVESVQARPAAASSCRKAHRWVAGVGRSLPRSPTVPSSTSMGRSSRSPVRPTASPSPPISRPRSCPRPSASPTRSAALMGAA